jgi:hypothetical protein
MQKLKSSEDIHANSLFVIKRGRKNKRNEQYNMKQIIFLYIFRWPQRIRHVR